MAVGTPYWFDIALNSVTGGTANMGNFRDSALICFASALPTGDAYTVTVVLS